MQLSGPPSGRLMQGDAVNAAATGGHRIYVDLHHLAARVEAGQQILAMAVGRLVAELRHYDGPVDRQVVDVAGGKVRAAAEAVVPPAQRGRPAVSILGVGMTSLYSFRFRGCS